MSDPAPDAAPVPDSPDLDAPDLARRFGGIGRLYGDAAAQRIAEGHVVVVGVGGVGSWAAEALARSGVGHLTLIDLDQVAESNVNRQIQALGSTLGMAKVDALARRIADINPTCRVDCIEEFVDPDNAATLVPPCDVLLDCCDQVRAKAALAALARQRSTPIVIAGAAGGKRHPERARVLDLGEVRDDPLLAKLRYRMRREYGAPRSGPMGLPCVCSDEPVRRAADPSCDAAPQGLGCAGYGSSVMVTAAFGLVAAARAVEGLVKPTRPAIMRGSGR